MTQSLHEFVLTRLEEAKGTWPSIAAATGVPYRTIEKIGRRLSRDPRVSHIEKLAKYFRDRSAA